ncbi:MAG: hypothetical protein MIN69_00240 [Methylorubrum extorquens]|uniref:hypothetical protein n=1 Tax=Methylorubrum extorquens TaxID=408 RepID=UPI002FEE5EE0
MKAAALHVLVIWAVMGVPLGGPDSMQLWRALIRPPAGKGPGSFADDAAHTPYWTPQSYPVFDTEEINYSVRGAFGASS